MVNRTILHVDMDAFFVAVELRRHPELVGRPVVVGGTGERGVVAAASYEARRFGVHSALSSAIARRRCPAAVFLPGDYGLYEQVSAEVHVIFERYTPLVEPLALDEAFLDVTGSQRLFGAATKIAADIRAAVADELRLGCSVGIAPNKFLAKLASVAAKPRATLERVEPGRGVVEVVPGGELEFLYPLDVGRLWGVGPVTLERLRAIGIMTVGDLAATPSEVVERCVGRSLGAHLMSLARAEDDRPVVVDRRAKSIGQERTYAEDLRAADDIRRELVRLADAVAMRIRASGAPARTLTLKVRFADFATITRSVTASLPVQTAAAIVRLVEPMLEAEDLRSRIGRQGVRLLGISASNFGATSEQLSLLDPVADDTDERASQALDEIRRRFGVDSILPASSVGSGVIRRGSQQWGPGQNQGRVDPDRVEE